MITVYGINGGNVARLRAGLIQKGLDFEHVSVDLFKKSKEFMDITPVGKIPVIKDSDGTVLWDSIHISLYLDFKYPDTYNMTGNEPVSRAKILNIVALADKVNELLPPLFFESSGFYDKILGTDHSFRAIKYSEKQKEDLFKYISGVLVRFEEILDGNKFFVNNFSLADAAVMGLLNTLNFMKVDIGSWNSWFEENKKDEKIGMMFAPQDEKGIRAI